jgi:hypothetical protein
LILSVGKPHPYWFYICEFNMPAKVLLLTGGYVPASLPQWVEKLRPHVEDGLSSASCHAVSE